VAINLNIPKETIQIDGKTKVTDMFEVTSFEPTKKIENTLNLVDTNGYVSVFNSSVLPVRRVYIQAPAYNKNIELEYVNKVKIIRNNIGASGTTEVEMYVEGVSILKFPESFGNLITDIQVATTSTNSKEIKVSIYGWEEI